MKHYTPLLVFLLVFGQKLFAFTDADKIATCRQVHVEPSWTIQQILDFQYYTNMANKDPDRIPCIEGSIQNALRQRKLYLRQRQIHESEDNTSVEDDKDRARENLYPAFEAALTEALYSYHYQKLAAEDPKLQDFVRNISGELDSQTRGTQGKWTMKSHVTSLQKFFDYIRSKLPEVTSIQSIQPHYNGVSEWTLIPLVVGPVTRMKKNLIQSTITIVTHTLEANGTKLIINGLYLRMSDVVAILNKLKLSENVSKYPNGSKLDEINDPEIEATKLVEIVEIHSKHIFYVDDNLNLTRSLLVIIAPVWKIVTEANIMLNALQPDQYELDDKPQNGVGPGADGFPGKPGHPGKAGGNFFALASEIDHPEKLTIHMQGGKSGDEQADSDGVKGKDGQALDYTSIKMGISVNEEKHIVTSMVTNERRRGMIGNSSTEESSDQ